MKWFKRLVGYFTGRALDDIARAAELAKKALPIVTFVAALTPTRADDEIIALFKKYTIPGVEAWLALPKEQRGRALMQAAASQLKRVAPDEADRVIDLAVQIAVVQLRSQEAGK